MLEPGQLVMLLNANDKRYFVTAQEGQVMHTNEGLLHLDEVRAQGYSEPFIRLWDFYLAYCEGGFEERALGDVHMLMAKPLYRG
jgi:cyclopropane fatty-acyl-phospholipid synthase-like methyltransferase